MSFLRRPRRDRAPAEAAPGDRRTPPADGSPAGVSLGPGPGPTAPRSTRATVAREDRTLTDLGILVGELEGLGHVVHLTDRTAGLEVPLAASRTAFLVLQDSVAVLRRRAKPVQQVHLRIRVDGEELVLSMQSRAEGPHAVPLAVSGADLAGVLRRVEDAGGRTTVRPTHGGNWIAIGRLPLRR